MRRLFLIVAGLTAAFAAAAQEKPVRRYSVEAGAGPAPIHTLLMSSFSSARREELREQGIQAHLAEDFPKAVSAAWGFSVNERTEILVTGSVSWRHYSLTRYPEFGTDPYGKPRYDMYAGEPMKEGLNEYCAALSASGRDYWYRGQHVRCYSGVGLGLAYPFSKGYLIPLLPELIPIGIQLGWSHMYAFAELTLGPHASLGRGGIGYRF